MADETMAAEQPTSTEIATAVHEHAPAMVAQAAIMSDDEIRRMWRIGKALAESGMFKTNESGGTTPEQAFTKMLIGRELGLNPAQSMTGIYLVKGNMQIAAVTLASFVRRHPQYDYRVLEHTAQICRIEFLRRTGAAAGSLLTKQWESLGVSEFTIEEAKSAELVKQGSGWAKYPRNMLFARAMSNGVKWNMPDLLGGMPVYTEADEFVDSTADELTAGEGDGSARGLDLGPLVDEVIERAGALRERGVQLEHPWLAERGSVEVRVGGQSPGYVEEWARGALAEVAAAEEANPIEEADVVPDEPVDPAPAGGQPNDVEVPAPDSAPGGAESAAPATDEPEAGTEPASLEERLAQAYERRAELDEPDALLEDEIGRLEAELGAARDDAQASMDLPS